MALKLILNAEIGHLGFLDKKFFNGDVEIFKIIFDYFKSRNISITLLITNKVWIKRDLKIEQSLNLLKNQGKIENFFIVDLINSIHKNISQNIYDSIKMKLLAMKESQKYSEEFSNVVNLVNPDFVFSFQDIFPVYYNSNVPLVVWGLHNSEYVMRYTNDKKENFLFKNQLFYLKLLLNNFFYRNRVKMVNLNLCPSIYCGKINRKIFKNKPTVIYFNHPTRDLKNKEPSFKSGKKKIVALIGTTQTTFAQSNLEFLAYEILSQYSEELTEFEFHIVGENKNNLHKLKKILSKFKNVKFCGYLDDLYMKILNSDIVLHAVKYPPTSGYKLPNICSGYPCLLLHKETFKGFPELFRNKACLSASTGREFVRKLKILAKNKSLSIKLRKNARKVYEKYYSLNNLPKILEKCEKMVYRNYETS
ncbi:MAG: hypothetical protein CBC25_07935 [Pelagibacteraceae bacterium TMED65]|nr:hypothetical protein [Rickettsiales bacterium]OUU50459.1 MAG: hypothetical protein CBC25_07935 [Pelagibacteraceae bacterium TMED65]